MNKTNNRRKKTRSILVYSLFGVIIVALAFYLIFRGSDRIQYQIPDIDAIAKSDIDSIEVSSLKHGEIELRRRGDEWVLMPGEFPADLSRIDSMLSAIEEFELTEVVSEAAYYGRFDLDEDARFRVRALSSGNELINIDIGKRSPTYNHTYVKLPEDDRVFQATGNLISPFDRDEDGLRDKLVFSIEPGLVLRVGVTTPEESYRIFKSVEGEEVKWTGSDSRVWDPEPIQSALDRLESLKASTYLDPTEAPTGEAAYVFEIQEESIHQIFIYGETESAYVARSSQNPYAFTISTYQAEQLIEAFTWTEEE